MRLWLKFNSRSCGHEFWSNMSSKSRNLHEERSSSLISFNLRPFKREFRISSVRRPEKVSLASRCSYGSIDMPSRTLSLRKWKMQQIRQLLPKLELIRFPDISKIINLWRSFSLIVSLTSLIKLFPRQSSIKHWSSSSPSSREISLFSNDSQVRLASICTFEILLILFEPRSNFFKYFKFSRF